MFFFKFGVALLGPEPHQTFVDGEAVQPGIECAIAAELLDFPWNRDENVHQDVFSLVAILEHSERKVQNVRAMGLPQHAKGFTTSLLNFLYDDFFVHFVIFDAWDLRVVAWAVNFFN